MGVALVRVFLLTGLFLCSIVPLQVSAAPDQWWNDAWSFRQEIKVPFDTSVDVAVYQPIDTTIMFTNPCWAVSDTVHSVRLICLQNGENSELESQIYDLSFGDDSHISSCNIVFLIPEGVDGSEQYFVYYDDAETIAPAYPDHVSIQDASYFYEPIPGYPLESHYYKVSQEGFIKYVVAQEGKFLWYTTSQYVTKLVEGTKEMMPKNGEAIASFEFVYYYDEEMWEYSSTSQQLVSKEILCDGTLMVSCRIVSRSDDAALQTTAVYKYFYAPLSASRIHVHVVHEALSDCQVYPVTNTDGTYASLQCGGIRSSSIADLNFGRLYPFYHVYSERDTVEEYEVDMNPEYTADEPVIRLLQTTDDVDVGKSAWVSFDEGASGAVHALVFGSSSVVKQGVDERDGMQLKMYESDYPHLPGLDYTVAALECTRNSYEGDTGLDTVIPKGFVAEYDAEFFSSPIGGYPLVEREAAVFQSLVLLKPSSGSNGSGEDNETVEGYSLSVSVHHAPSAPLGSMVSALTGRSLSYSSVEVYHDDVLVCSGTAGRLPLKSSESSVEGAFLARLKTVLGLLDLKNASVFKTIEFQGLAEGRYVIKVFQENPFMGRQRRFIGYSVVDLSSDKNINIFCTKQGVCRVSVVDQENNGVTGAVVQLLSDGVVLSENTTVDGSVVLSAPSGLLERYQLRVLYHGFELKNDSVRFGLSRRVMPLLVTVAVDQYEWRLRLVDSWGLGLDVPVSPRLSSAAMTSPFVVQGTQKDADVYEFLGLVPATYTLQIQYKSVLLEKDVVIPSADAVVEFPVEFPVTLRVLDARGGAITGAVVRLSRGGKSVEATSNGSGVVLSLPPGEYLVTVLSGGEVVGQRSLTVSSERSVNLITIQEPLFPFLVVVLACIVMVIGLVWGSMKKDVVPVLLFVVVGLLVVSLVFPWWSLHGESSGVETSSVLYVLPLDLLTATKTASVLAGERSFIPDVFTMVITTILALTAVSSVCVLGSLMVRRLRKKRWQVICLVGAVVLLFGSLVLFYGAMSAFTEVGVGSFLGQGPLEVSIQGTDMVVPVFCSWGPGVGFWLYLIAGVVLISTLLIFVVKKKEKK